MHIKQPNRQRLGPWRISRDAGRGGADRAERPAARLETQSLMV